MFANSEVAVAIFNEKAETVEAVSDLRNSGFHEDDIVVGFFEDCQDADVNPQSVKQDSDGLAAATIRARWGISILAGAVTVCRSAEEVALALKDLGLPEDEVAHYDDELRQGRILIAVLASGRHDLAQSILSRAGGRHLVPHRL
jgi:hypothetical protein